MGSYLNPGSKSFQESLNSEIYVDKSCLIRSVNRQVNTQQKYLCVSRPRRFGKSMALAMLSAYYDCSIDAEPLFRSLAIAKDTSFRQYMNQFNVLRINMQNFRSRAKNVDSMLEKLQKTICSELRRARPDIFYMDEDDLIQMMMDAYSGTGKAFVILIDEWDCLFRVHPEEKEDQARYLDFLRLWLKDQEYIALVYMTGILPIKKYGTHSALNMFREYSMTDPWDLAPFFGFTEKEVQALCRHYNRSFEEAKAWYDGYCMLDATPKYTVGTPSAYIASEPAAVYGAAGQRNTTVFVQEEERDIIHSMYSPRSIVESMLSGHYDTYWNQTETYEALKVYICMNYDGLKDAIVRMLAGETIEISTRSFSNDMRTFGSRDDVLTLLIHLGYLSYDSRTRSVRIPNKEVSEEYLTAIQSMDWPEVTRSIMESKALLEALWAGDGETVANGVERAHEEISILTYKDENSLSCTITLAFYFAREYYTIVRELPAGKGFADIAMIPRRKYADKPALLIELKRDQTAEGAIAQIHERHYAGALTEYMDNLLLCGIRYDSKSKTHSCVIEKLL